MPRRELQNQETETISLSDREGQWVVGEYVGSKIIRPKGKDYDQSIHEFFDIATGEKFSIWGFTVLDGKMKGAKVGETIEMKYLGKAMNEKNGREYYDVQVCVVEGDETPRQNAVREESSNPDDLPF